MDYMDVWQQIQQFFATPLGVSLALGASTTGISTLVTNFLQNRRANVFPVLFSREDSLSGRNEATNFYAAVNDATMYVTKAWNTARKSKNYNNMLTELKMSRLPSTTMTVQQAGATLQKRLEEYVQLSKIATEAQSFLDASWDYSSRDNYRTEIYYETDSKGQRQMRTRQVYESTDHYFEFDREQAIAAQKKLKEALQYDPNTLYDPEIKGQVTPRPEDIELIKQTIFENNEKEVTKEQATSYLSEWIRCAHAACATKEVKNTLTQLEALATDETFTIINASRPNYHFRTYGRSCNAPEGYDRTRSLSADCESISKTVTDLSFSIQACIENAKFMRQIAHTYHVEKPKDLAFELLDKAVESYTESFPTSEINMDQRVSHGMNALISLSAGLLTGIGMYLYQTW